MDKTWKMFWKQGKLPGHLHSTAKDPLNRVLAFGGLDSLCSIKIRTYLIHFWHIDLQFLRRYIYLTAGLSCDFSLNE